MPLPVMKKWFDAVDGSDKQTMPSMLRSPHSWDIARTSDGMKFAISVEVECGDARNAGPVLSVAKELVAKKMAELKAELALLKECKLDVTNVSARCGKTVYGLVVHDQVLPLD